MTPKDKIEAIERESKRIVSLYPDCVYSMDKFNLMPDTIVEYGIELNDLWAHLTNHWSIQV